MSINSEPFTPAGTVSRTVSGTTASVALAIGGKPQTVVVSSLAANAIAFIKFGSSTVEAVAATSMPILPNTVLCLSPPATATHVAAIGSAGTLYFTSGHGRT